MSGNQDRAERARAFVGRVYDVAEDMIEGGLQTLKQETFKPGDALGAQRFFRAVEGAVRAAKLAASLVIPVGRGSSDDGNEDEVIPVELAGTTKLVPRSAVRYVEAQGDYARLHTHEGSHLVRIPLSVLEDRWRDAGFVRIHRSFLVSLPLVTELRLSGSGYVVRVGSGPDCAELPVSRRHTRELKDRLVRATKQAWSQR